MNTILAQCRCGYSGQVSAELIGKTLICKKCGREFTLVQPRSGMAADESENSQIAKRPNSMPTGTSRIFWLGILIGVGSVLLLMLISVGVVLLLNMVGDDVNEETAVTESKADVVKFPPNDARSTAPTSSISGFLWTPNKKQTEGKPAPYLDAWERPTSSDNLLWLTGLVGGHKEIVTLSPFESRLVDAYGQRLADANQQFEQRKIPAHVWHDAYYVAVGDLRQFLQRHSQAIQNAISEQELQQFDIGAQVHHLRPFMPIPRIEWRADVRGAGNQLQEELPEFQMRYPEGVRRATRHLAQYPNGTFGISFNDQELEIVDLRRPSQRQILPIKPKRKYVLNGNNVFYPAASRLEILLEDSNAPKTFQIPQARFQFIDLKQPNFRDLFTWHSRGAQVADVQSKYFATELKQAAAIPLYRFRNMQGTNAVFTSSDGILIWDATTDKTVRHAFPDWIPTTRNFSSRHFAVSPDSRHALVLVHHRRHDIADIDSFHVICLFDFSKGQFAGNRLLNESDSDYVAKQIAFRDDGRQFAILLESDSYRGTRQLLVFDSSSGEMVNQIADIPKFRRPPFRFLDDTRRDLIWLPDGNGWIIDAQQKLYPDGRTQHIEFASVERRIEWSRPWESAVIDIMPLPNNRLLLIVDDLKNKQIYSTTIALP